jgi:hypothetical protein
MNSSDSNSVFFASKMDAGSSVVVVTGTLVVEVTTASPLPEHALAKRRKGIIPQIVVFA